MIGGLIKSNRMAAIAGAGIIAGALSVSPAQAADFGGDCCADLEERVATLEATTARKGNRKVSLTISGWVNTAVMIWDDGVNEDAYVQSDNGTTLGSRFTFAGSAKINHDWSAGYNITIEVQSDDPFLGNFLETTQPLDPGTSQTDDDNSNFSVFYSYMYIKSERWGELSIGRQSQATDNISIVDLSGTLFSANNVLFRGNFFDTGNGVPWAAAVNCNGIGIDCHGDSTDSIKYTTPTFAGFTLSATWGEDDFYDVALKYAGDFGDFKFGAAAGYSEWNDGDLLVGAGGPSESELFEAGASIMHVPTGLFVSGSYSHYETYATGGMQIIENDAWYVKAGIKQKWNSLGATAIYGEYGVYADGFDRRDLDTTAAELIADGGDDSEVHRYGVGIHQWIDAAAMQVYFNWTHLEIDGSSASGAFVDDSELDTFTLGGVIFF